MKTIETILRKELTELQAVIKEANKNLCNVPEGNLRISNKNGITEYYLKNAVGNGKYLKKQDQELAYAIAQRDYDREVLRRARERKKAIESFLQKYEKSCLKKLYRDINPYRKALIQTNIISDEEYVRRWLAVEYNGRQGYDEIQDFYTEKEERVRSKSEKIIADKLYRLGIPYRYEYPLILQDNIKIYPDFTILKMPEREEVYLEHFGMMDDLDYVRNVMRKLNTYEKNGIYIGVNLFVTYESVKYPLNTKGLDGLLKQLFNIEKAG